VIATGFPAGRVDVFVGDEVSIEIENVGRLTNKLVSEKEYYS
jgi:5-oxopent-3-ene-1,2,5-tricarboxylate decarboxylase/2-hydroxyhepta-2,4-diene-1,7-dioate isomerase